MRFIPYDKLELQTKLTPNEVQELLSQNTFKTSFYTNYSDTNKLLEGAGESFGKFKIKRHIKCRNSFAPIMYGNYSEVTSGTNILVKFKMHLVVTVFTTIWLSGTLLGFLFGLFVTMNGEPFLKTPAVMFVMGYFLIIIAFNFELRKSKQLLTKLLSENNACL